jgi:hypothetical protein
MLRGKTPWAVRAAVIVAGLLLPLVPVASASAAGSAYRVSEYRYRSEPGDWIGQGATAVISDPTQISVTGDAGFIRASGGPWTLEFRAPSGEVLAPGVYAHAERAAFVTGRSPGLEVTGESRGCNEVFGRFAVNQIQTDAIGNVTALDVRFVQHCEAADAPALRGWFRYRVAPLSYAFTSDAGDYIGGGASERYEGATTLFHPFEQYGGGIRVRVSGQRDDWWIVLLPPSGGVLTEGTYPDALRFADAGHPGLDVYGDGRGCNEVTGSFEILAIRLGDSGRVKRLDATFEQHCEGATPALHGELRFHA